MAKDIASRDFTVGIIGTGAMGRGIAQIMASGGMIVLLFDVTEGAAEAGRAFAERMILRAAEKGAISDDDAKSAAGRLRVVGAVADMAACDLVIEAVVEDIGVKRQVFGGLEDVVAADCILATNTSSLSVTAIGAGLERPERFAGSIFSTPCR